MILEHGIAFRHTDEADFEIGAGVRQAGRRLRSAPRSAACIDSTCSIQPGAIADRNVALTRKSADRALFSRYNGDVTSCGNPLCPHLSAPASAAATALERIA